jgi:hypothetical protein
LNELPDYDSNKSLQLGVYLITACQRRKKLVDWNRGTAPFIPKVRT